MTVTLTARKRGGAPASAGLDPFAVQSPRHDGDIDAILGDDAASRGWSEYRSPNDDGGSWSTHGGILIAKGITAPTGNYDQRGYTYPLAANGLPLRIRVGFTSYSQGKLNTQVEGFGLGLLQAGGAFPGIGLMQLSFQSGAAESDMAMQCRIFASGTSIGGGVDYTSAAPGWVSSPRDCWQQIRVNADRTALCIDWSTNGLRFVPLLEETLFDDLFGPGNFTPDRLALIVSNRNGIWPRIGIRCVHLRDTYDLDD